MADNNPGVLTHS